MTEQELKKTLFDAYSNQLSALPQFAECPQVYDTFVCPICLREFGRASLVDNSLTLEHFIPSKLGGGLQTATLTCWDCNNIGGARIDHHLMDLIDSQDFLSGRTADSRVIVTRADGNRMTSELSIRTKEGNRTFHAHLNRDHSPPEFDVGLARLREGVDVPVEFEVKLPHNRERAQLAFARIGFLMMFRQYGYAYVLRPNVDYIRQQLVDPGAEPARHVIVSDFRVPATYVNRVALVSLPGDQQAFAVVVRLERRDERPTDGTRQVRTRDVLIVMPGLDDPDEVIYDRIRSVGAMGTQHNSKMMFLDHDIRCIVEPRNILLPLQHWSRFRQIRSLASS